MSANIAVNRSTGEVLVLTPDGQWERPRMAVNPQTGARLFYDGAAWQPMPERQASALDRLTMGVRDVAQGALALPGVAYNAVGAGLNLGMDAVEAIGGPRLPRVRTAEQNIDALADAAGLARPETSGERLTSAGVRAVAGTLPTIGAGLALQATGAAPAVAQTLAGQIPSQLVGAATGGVAGEAAAQAGADPLVQLGATVLGGAAGATATQAVQAGARAVPAMLQPFSERGREGIVADVLLRGSAQPTTLADRLRAGTADVNRRLPGSPVTTGTAARDPGLLVLEQGLRARADATGGGPAPASVLRDLDARRNATRFAELLRMQDGSTPELRGAAIRQGLDTADEGMRARVNQAFAVARDRAAGARFSMDGFNQRAAAALRPFTAEQGGGGVPAELQAVVDDVQRIGRLSLNQAQNIRARLGDLIGQGRITQNNRLVAAATDLQRALESAVDDPRWMQAVALRRQQGLLMGTDEGGNAATGAIVRQGTFGTPRMPETAVPNTALRTPATARQVIDALYQGVDDARTARLPSEQIEAARASARQAHAALRGQFMENLMTRARTSGVLADAAGNATDVLSPAQFARAWRESQPVAREIFEPGHLRALDRLFADFAETSLQTTTARARGSDTAQNLSVGNFLARVSNGLIDPENPLAQMLGSGAGLMRIIYQPAEAATRDMLTRAVADPEFASILLQRATPAMLRRAIGYVDANMADRVGTAATDAGIRAMIRALAATGSQPDQPARQ